MGVIGQDRVASWGASINSILIACVISSIRLQVFTKVTKEMSRSRTPTLPYVLPMYEHMFKNLDAYARDEKISPDLRNAAAAGLRKLNEYYNLAQASQFTLLATSTLLHCTVHMC